MQRDVFLPVFWVVSLHALAVVAQVREFVKQSAVRHPAENVNQLVIHKVQIGDVFAHQVWGVARVLVQRLEHGAAACEDCILVWVFRIAWHRAS